MCDITVTVQRILCCCITRHTINSTLQPRRSHRKGFGPAQYNTWTDSNGGARAVDVRVNGLYVACCIAMTRYCLDVG